MTNNQQALDAALAQIDAAFGKGSSGHPERVNMKVWMDPFTEDHVFRWIRDEVEAYLPDAFDERMWENIRDDMDEGMHRVLDYHPFDRMYPPVTLGEWIGLFFRRLFGRFQRTEHQKLEREMAKWKAAPPQPGYSFQAPKGTLEDPPF